VSGTTMIFRLCDEDDEELERAADTPAFAHDPDHLTAQDSAATIHRRGSASWARRDEDALTDFHEPADPPSTWPGSETPTPDP
jgi:hypothetical protein